MFRCDPWTEHGVLVVADVKKWIMVPMEKNVRCFEGIMSDTLRSDRLILRRLTTDDAAHLARLLGDDSESIQMMAQMPDPCTEEAAGQWIEMRTSGDAHAFAIIRAESEEFVGSIGFGGRLEMLGLGYWIGRQYRGKGYATEAVRLIVGLARSLGGLKLQAETFPNNPASARVLDKAGFKKIGAVVKDFPTRGGLREVYQHELELVSGEATPARADPG